LRLHEPKVRRQIQTGGVRHLTVAPWLALELREAGVQAEVLPLSPIGNEPILPPAADPFTLLSYLPDHKFEFYGGPSVYAAAAAFPDVRFLVVGGSGDERPAPGNVVSLGVVEDMTDVYARTHVLLRHARHDGLPYMVLEALNFGRHAIWNYPIPGVRVAVSQEEVLRQIDDCRAAHAAGSLGVNAAGRDYVRTEFGRETIRRRISAVIDAAVDAGPKGASKSD
jgi:hypothetical protein